jgi:hypothetical protein
MKEGVEIDQTARKASLYDLWLPSDDQDSSAVHAFAALLNRLMIQSFPSSTHENPLFCFYFFYSVDWALFRLLKTRC